MNIELVVLSQVIFLSSSFLVFFFWKISLFQRAQYAAFPRKHCAK